MAGFESRAALALRFHQFPLGPCIMICDGTPAESSQGKCERNATSTICSSGGTVISGDAAVSASAFAMAFFSSGIRAIFFCRCSAMLCLVSGRHQDADLRPGHQIHFRREHRAVAFQINAARGTQHDERIVAP